MKKLGTILVSLSVLLTLLVPMFALSASADPVANYYVAQDFSKYTVGVQKGDAAEGVIENKEFKYYGGTVEIIETADGGKALQSAISSDLTGVAFPLTKQADLLGDEFVAANDLEAIAIRTKVTRLNSAGWHTYIPAIQTSEQDYNDWTFPAINNWPVNDKPNSTFGSDLQTSTFYIMNLDGTVDTFNFNRDGGQWDHEFFGEYTDGFDGWFIIPMASVPNLSNDDEIKMLRTDGRVGGDTQVTTVYEVGYVYDLDAFLNPGSGAGDSSTTTGGAGDSSTTTGGADDSSTTTGGATAGSKNHYDAFDFADWALGEVDLDNYPGGVNFNGNYPVIVENEDGLKGLQLNMEGSDWSGPAFSFPRPDNAETGMGADFDYTKIAGIAIRMKYCEQTVAGVKYDVFPRFIVNGNTFKTSSGGDGLDEPGSENYVYLIDAKKGVLEKNVKIADGKWWTTHFIPDAFDGWVILPAEGFRRALNGKTISSLEFSFRYMTPQHQITWYDIDIVYDLDAYVADVTKYVAPPTIKGQPEDAVVKNGETATFKVEAESPNAGTLTYQWEVSADGGETWTAIEGATAATYTTPALAKADDGKLYRCFIVNTIDDAVTNIYTEAAELLVDRLLDTVVEMDMYDPEKVPADQFTKYIGIADSHLIISLMDGDMVGYSWMFDGADIKEGVEFNPAIERLDPTELEEATESDVMNALYFVTKHTDKFPGKATFAIDSSFNFADGETVYLYKYNPTTKQFAKVDVELEQVEGMTRFEIDAAGYYVLNNAEIGEAGDDEGFDSGIVGGGDEESNTGSGSGDVDGEGEDTSSPVTGESTTLVAVMALMLCMAAAVVFSTRARAK